MFEAADQLKVEYAQLEGQLSDPATPADMARARKIGRRYAELAPIVKALNEHEELTGDLEAARELAGEDASFADEADRLANAVDSVVTWLADPARFTPEWVAAVHGAVAEARAAVNP